MMVCRGKIVAIDKEIAMRTAWNFHSAGQLVFGRGAAAQIGSLAARRKLSRVFLVTDERLAVAGLVERVVGPLREANVSVEIYRGGEPEPAIDTAIAAAEAARKFRPDCVLGLGGGSNMDLAKIVAVLLTHGGEPARYFGFDNVPGPLLPLICVPTTAGTGSEVSHAAVLTDTANRIKVSTLSQFLRPALAVVDPALTDGCPRQVTADSGIDALTHAIEAYTAIDFDQLDAPDGAPVAYEGRFPLGECLAEKAIGLIGQHLVMAVKDGANRAARDGMALAATVAGLAFSNCAVALVHALEYPLGGAVHVSHGAGNGLLLPHVMRYNLPTRKKAFARIARLLGVETSVLTIDAAADSAIAAVERIRAEIGIPQRLRDLGAQRDQLPGFAEKAFAIKRLMGTNPRQPTQADLIEILQQAY
jgi:alcohol dehydrogenase class IV